MLKTIYISGKCSDLFYMEGRDEDGNTIKKFEHDGYVPSDLGFGGGDYVEMEIDITTGQIVGWKPLDEESILEELRGDDYDEDMDDDFDENVPKWAERNADGSKWSPFEKDGWDPVVDEKYM